MKERPIIFSAPMVRSILEGRKTQTRRIMNAQPDRAPIVYQAPLDRAGKKEALAAVWGDNACLCPYGAGGDRLWVRETWREREPDQDSYSLEFRADRPEYKTRDDDPCAVPWRPSIHMPRTCSRINLDVTGVRVERLQEISQADCIAEGMPESTNGFLHHVIADYRKLWSEINGVKSWDANPWVWVVEFKRAAT